MKKLLKMLLFCILAAGMASVTNAAPVGEIDGDVLYKNIEARRIFDEPLANTLGIPIKSRELQYFYDGVEVNCFLHKKPDNSRVEYVDLIKGTDLTLFTINGVTLNKTRAELIAAFGKPIEYYKYPDNRYYYKASEYRASDNTMMLRYHVSNYICNYVIDFWFDQPNGKAATVSLNRNWPVD